MIIVKKQSVNLLIPSQYKEEGMELNAQQVRIRVSSERIRETGERIREKTNCLGNRLGEMQDTVKMTAGFWEGEAGDLCREAFEQFREDIAELTARLTENVEDLEKIAGVYDESERAAQEEAEALPENVIV